MGGGGLVQQLRRSYSLSDLSTDKDMADVNRNNKALSNIPDDDTDEADEGSIDPRLLRPRGYSPRRSASGSGRVEMYFPEVDVDVRQHASRQREPSIPLSHIRSSEDVSSGYSSAEPLYAGHHQAKGEGLVQSREPLIRTASVGSTRSVRPKSSRGGVVSKRTPTTEDSEPWSNEEAVFTNQEEYTYYVSSSLPSQLASIPLAEQNLAQAELLLILQEIRSLRAQRVVDEESLAIKSIESELQLTETKSENVPEVCIKSESMQHIEAKPENVSETCGQSESIEHTETHSENVPEVCVKSESLQHTEAKSENVPGLGNESESTHLNIYGSESSPGVIETNVCSFSMNLAGSEPAGNELEVPESKPETSVIDDSESSTPIAENYTNSAVEATDDSEMFVDADATTTSSVPEGGSAPVAKNEEAVESPCNEDTFVDANTDAQPCVIVTSQTCNAESTGVPIPEVTVDFDSDKVEDKPAESSDAMQFSTSGDLGMVTAEGADERVEQCPEGKVESRHISSINDNGKSLSSPMDHNTDVPLQLETYVSLSESAKSFEDFGLCVDESATSDTLADLSMSSDQTSELKSLDMSNDLNASSETLKLSDEYCISEQSEIPATLATAQLPEQPAETTLAGSSDEKKYIRSGRYHKRLAPTPPEKCNESAVGAVPDLNGLTGNEILVHEQMTDEIDQINIETAVKARLVLQPGIVKAVGPDTSGTEKFISSSPKAKRKAAPHTKAKQKGSTISRLLVMPKNQFGHFASFLPFWGSRDTKGKSAESVSSAGSNTREQINNVSPNQEKEKEIISEAPLLPPRNNNPPSRRRMMPMSSCSLEYLPYIESDNEFDSSGIDKAKSSSISDFKIREMSHSPPSTRRSEQLPQ